MDLFLARPTPHFLNHYLLPIHPHAHPQAAKTLGYKTKEDWDESIDLPYMDKEFVELTHDEKQAMRLVGLEPLDKFEDIWWEDCDSVSKKAAKTLGFDEHEWDHDYAICDLEVEEKNWNQLSEEQRKAARYFGYNRSTWDEVDYDDDDSYTSDDDEKLESGMENLNVEAGGGKKPNKKPGKPKPKVKFGCTTMFGGEGGGEFDDRMHPRIKAITLRGGKVIDGITILYSDGEKTHGGDGGGGHTIMLKDGEYVNYVKVKAGDKLVQHLTFKTNKGQELSAGGSGGLLLDKEGEDFECRAPPNNQMCGIKGRSGKFIDAIAIHWGPIPK